MEIVLLFLSSVEFSFLKKGEYDKKKKRDGINNENMKRK